MRQRLINGDSKRLENWSLINWRKAIKVVKNLRYRIFRARNLGNFRRLRRLQKLMLRSQSNLLLSIRQITQVNTGKRTAGIDKEVINTPPAACKTLPRNGKRDSQGQTNQANLHTQIKWKETSSRNPHRER
ncbi:reverse transcriptase N-terminal domain-containing protein [Nostoc sp. C057]|uniref:reverse transcriptase N-terminal domain-containing protein n=1 Tax=Nostoc sp. C057 TaxID=2576903 RepID=UPI00277B57CF|nr:reverse transcriptase N-terminal domain-containing protein [Nostoc sp. C057]